jgi:pimeloyl-ACP methyl ester carboxylesterase
MRWPAEKQLPLLKAKLELPQLKTSYIAREPFMPMLKINAPKFDLFDEITKITIHGGMPGEIMHVKVNVRDAKQFLWESEAYFKIPRSSTISLNSDRPLYGTWNTKNTENGAFWSMAPQFPRGKKKGQRPSSLTVNKLKKLKYQIFASSNGEKGKQTIEKFFQTPNVALRHLKKDGLVGELYYPKKKKGNLPLIIFTTGSGGGILGIRQSAQVMASRGFPSLALPYFNYPGLPKTLENIPLEYFSKASQWLRQQNDYQNRKVVIVGGSRGGELSLLLALHFPADFHAVVARVPAMHVWGGFNGKPKADPAWLLDGKPLAFMDSDKVEKGIELPSGLAVSAYFMEILKEKNKDPSLIPVERIRCPVLLLGARDDQMWPSGFFVEEMAKRMNRRKTVVHILEDGGHICFSMPNAPRHGWAFNHPVDGGAYAFGGSPVGDARASLVGYRAFLDFLGKV